MQIGDVVTYKQREDLAEHPTPYHRLGTVVRTGTQMHGDTEKKTFDVYWWDSANFVMFWEDQLEEPSYASR